MNNTTVGNSLCVNVAMIAYVTRATFTLLISGTDHRVIQEAHIPLRLVADFTVNDGQHHLLQQVWYFTAGCSRQ